MITVRVRRRDESGAEVIVRVTAKNIETAARLTGGRVVFPIEPSEFFRGSGSSSFFSFDVLEETA